MQGMGVVLSFIVGRVINPPAKGLVILCTVFCGKGFRDEVGLFRYSV